MKRNERPNRSLPRETTYAELRELRRLAQYEARVIVSLRWSVSHASAISLMPR